MQSVAIVFALLLCLVAPCEAWAAKKPGQRTTAAAAQKKALAKKKAATSKTATKTFQRIPAEEPPSPEAPKTPAKPKVVKEDEVQEFPTSNPVAPSEPAVTETAPIPTGPPSPTDTNANIVEVLETRDHVEFVELDKIEAEPIRWDQNSGRFLYIAKGESPFLFLSGTIAEGYELAWNDKWVKQRSQRFEIKIPLPAEPTIFRLKVFQASREFRVYRFSSIWTRFTFSAGIRVEGDDPTAAGYTGKYKHSAAVQIYEGNDPVTQVDLDAQRLARHTIRIFYPAQREESYDSWRMTIRNSKGKVISALSRYGSPPLFLDWREVNGPIIETDTYSYRIDLMKDKQVFPGMPNTFRTIEGLSILKHKYLPLILIEPKEELGYYSFRNDAGVEYSNLYIGADIPIIFGGRFILRGMANLSVHSINPLENFSQLRYGAGMRIHGAGDSDTWGRPYLLRVDILLNHGTINIYNDAPVKRYSQFSLLVEPHVVLWAYHYIVPWVEFGAKADLRQQRVSLGLTYQFFIRPWSVKLGMGLTYDWMYLNQEAPLMKFSVFRTLTNFTFFL